MPRLHFALVMAISVGFVGCPKPAQNPPVDSGTVEPPPVKRDGGQVVVTPDAAVRYPETFAGEACPPDSFAPQDSPDGSVVFGLCAVLVPLTGEALLNGKPVKGNVNLQLLGGGFQSEVDQTPDAFGRLEVQALRSKYDLLQFWPSGVFPTYKGYESFGFLDLTTPQTRSFSVKSHTLRGSALYGSVPFVPNAFPQDVSFEATGTPAGQQVAATSQGGAYEVSLLEGAFALFLSTPSKSLSGTELRGLQLNTANLDFTHDQEFNIDLPTSILEGEITIDGQPVPDRRVGADYDLAFVKPGDPEASVFTHHEGGLAQFSALVPKNPYGIQLSFQAQPDHHLPSQIANKALSSYVDLTHDNRLTADLKTFQVEGAVLLDGQPIRSLPSANWRLYLFGAANNIDVSSFLLYEIPQDFSSFVLRVFPARYTVLLVLDDNLADDLVQGFWVVNRYFEVTQNTSLPIDIDTAYFTGHLLVDGKAAPAGKRAGWLTFRNRALTGEYSWFRRAITVGEDGFYRVRLPKGEYEVHFTIDPETFPTYASGRQLMASRVPLDETVVQDLNYDTVAITGPLRVQRQVVPNSIGGPEVGLRLVRSDLQAFTWNFEGGNPNYVLRVPKGDYSLEFVVNQGAFSGTAWGRAPMGVRMNLNAVDPLELDPR